MDVRSMQELHCILNKVTEYLSPFLSLANAHTVDFIVNNSWENKIPRDIRCEAESFGIDEIISQLWYLLEKESLSDGSCRLYDFVKKADECTIEKLSSTHYIEDPASIFPDSYALVLKSHVKVTEFMNAKKLHEVHIMSNVVACLAEKTKSSVIIDIGSGKGYLPSLLALNHRLRILGIDDKPTNVDGAIRTTKLLEKKWKIYERKSFAVNDGCKTGNNFDSTHAVSSNRNEENLSKSSVLGVSYKQRIESVSSRTNIRKILLEEYPDEIEHAIVFVGLHTCGNLSPNSLELFINCEQKVKSIINIGCCYHLLHEEFAENPEWHRQRTQEKCIESNDFGFPMSNYLKKRRFALGRDARMCGTQNPLKIFQKQELIKATKPLFYRALLQELLILKCGASNLPEKIVGRMAHKCGSFAEYAMKALKKLNLSIMITPAELDDFELKHTEHWNKLKIFFLLKTALSPVIETVILLDKLLYCYEKGAETAFVTRLFDPILSPRCYAIICINGVQQ